MSLADIHSFAHAPGAEYLTVELVNIQFWYYSVWIFFFFTVTSYLLGYIGYTLAMEKEKADGNGKFPAEEISSIAKQQYSVRRSSWKPRLEASPAPFRRPRLRLRRQIRRVVSNGS